MTDIVIGGGGAVAIASERGRIATGPWGRWLVASIVADEGTARAERGRRLARAGAVHCVVVAPGSVAARVTGDSGTEYRVELRAEPVPLRVWTAVTGSDAGRELLDAALEGRARAVRLEHAMTVDWDEPLVPRARDVHRLCDCPDHDLLGAGRACKHVAALGYALAHLVDGDVSLLLRWRGCTKPAPRNSLDRMPPGRAPAVAGEGIWEAGALPTLAEARPLPVGAVVKRLGRSGIRAGSDDLADVLLAAYRAFAADEPSRP